MPDYSHGSKEFEKMLQRLDNQSLDKSEKTWIPSPKMLNAINSGESWKDYDTKRISIDKLIEDNDLNNPVALNNHFEIWSPTQQEDDIDPTKFKYDALKDNDIGQIIHGVELPNGKIRLNDGRHRTRALKNAGYSHIVIPVKNDLMARQHPAIFGDYRSKDISTLNTLKRMIPVLAESYGDVFNINKNDVDAIKKEIANRILYLKQKYKR